ncbi:MULTISPECIES: hypothetical protein [unclassified Lactococcus]|uniref:hypothetical protein n=1 Tax=unclassified Lactococcus TaxID=2643510 RepID=UPI0011C9E187|nr:MULTISPECIES: hypothetical protein [unclassified Lactococcus]MQW23439.1 hypothetical protein [Lactococcus sp. dk101]TXK37049.1 hypothetical protein FVP42_10005 [Lactococcus sp. dk310]TXK37281.1 hypothetical protein FVP42_09235 [Lactococcus sp. dk310]TXK47723.1 hypothetical protein FVP43_09850 [Lactococcus sp. dk322]
MTREEMKLMLIEFLAEDFSKEPCIIDEEQFNIGKFIMVKEIGNFISEMEKKEIEIDLEPYHELLRSVRQLREAEFENLMEEMAQGI